MAFIQILSRDFFLAATPWTVVQNTNQLQFESNPADIPLTAVRVVYSATWEIEMMGLYSPRNISHVCCPQTVLLRHFLRVT